MNRKQIRIILTNCLILLVLMVCPISVKAGDLSKAKAVNVNESVQGFCLTNQTNYYKFTTGTELSCYTLEASAGSDNNISIGICDDLEIKLISVPSVDSKGTAISVKLKRNTTYYIYVSPNNGQYAFYSFRITGKPDTADQLSEAKEIGIGELVNDTSCVSSDEDWFKFTTGGELSSYTLNAIGKTGTVSIDICDEMEKRLVSGFVAGSEGNSLTLKLDPGTTYYICVYPNNCDYAEYSLKITGKRDAPDTMQTANPVDITKTVKSDICTNDDIDWFAFDTDSKGKYTFSVVGIDNSVSLSVCNKKQTELLAINGVANSGGQQTVYLKGGTRYYVKIMAASPARYSFTAKKENFSIPKPAVKSLSGKNRVLAVELSLVEADGYEVQYSRSRKMTSAKKVQGMDVFYTINRVTKNKTYYVRARAYKIVDECKIYSGWSSVKKVKVTK